MTLGRALAGIRVVDLSMGWAGPLAARHLADMGADVIKVESCQRFDWWRGWDTTPETLAQHIHEKAPAFNMVNRNKRGITLDLTREAGKSLLKRLVSLSDVVVENYSAEVLGKLDLDYAVLQAVRTDLVMVSMPAFGTSGPWRGYRAYGSTVEQASGLPHLNGEAQWPPTMQHVAYGDAVGGINGAAAVLTALYHRAVTGQGQYVDLSQVECLFPLAAHGIVAQTLNGAAPARRGSRRDDACPSGVFPCLGDDQWVTVQVFDEAQWRALCDVIGAADLQPLGRRERLDREHDVEKRIADWTRKLTPHAAMGRLQEAAVPAALLHGGRDLLDDAQLVARGFWQRGERAHVGALVNPAAPYRVGAASLPIHRPAPTLGEHNEDVLTGLLGLSRDALSDLEAQGIIGTRPRAD